MTSQFCSNSQLKLMLVYRISFITSKAIYNDACLGIAGLEQVGYRSLVRKVVVIGLDRLRLEFGLRKLNFQNSDSVRVGATVRAGSELAKVGLGLGLRVRLKLRLGT